MHVSDKQPKDIHFDKNTSQIGQERKLLPCTSQELKNGLCEKMKSIKQKGRMLYNTPSQNYTRKDNFRQSQTHFTHYEHGAMELWTGDGLNVHMEQSR